MLYSTLEIQFSMLVCGDGRPHDQKIGVGAIEKDYLKLNNLQGLKTFVGTNQSLTPSIKQNRWGLYQELWGYYPDDTPLHTLALKGDSRAALAPFLAYRYDVSPQVYWAACDHAPARLSTGAIPYLMLNLELIMNLS